MVSTSSTNEGAAVSGVMVSTSSTNEGAAVDRGPR